MPAGAVYVGRPTIWGNSYAVSRSSDFHGLPGSWFVRGEAGTIHHPERDTQASARQKAVDLYASQVLHEQDARISVEMIRGDLAGHDLVCWCPSDEPCHADFLLATANAPATRTSVAPSSTTARPLDLSHGSCLRCGGPLSIGDPTGRDLMPGDGARDLSVTSAIGLVTCVVCGHHDVVRDTPSEPRRPGHSHIQPPR